MKILLGISPAGLITFLSESYGGRASDKAIVNDCNVLDKLDSHVDSVLVDKGFKIDDECADRFIALIEPPFLRNKSTISTFIYGDSRYCTC